MMTMRDPSLVSHGVIRTSMGGGGGSGLGGAAAAVNESGPIESRGRGGGTADGGGAMAVATGEEGTSAAASSTSVSFSWCTTAGSHETEKRIVPCLERRSVYTWRSCVRKWSRGRFTSPSGSSRVNVSLSKTRSLSPLS